MTERKGNDPILDENELKKVKVNMVGWTCDDSYVITSASDHSIKIWEASTGKCIHSLREHQDDVFVLEAHPLDPRVFLSGGHDGRIIIWDVISGKSLKTFQTDIAGQGHSAIFDCKFSKDGHYFASTDSHGHIYFYGFGSSERYQRIPSDVFFHTDYRPLIRDANHYVIDEQTQCPPHQMPPPFLVDVDGNPHPPDVQKLVPGRENCNDEQLVPYITVNNERGVAEVLEPVDRDQGPVIPAPPPTIDDMIHRLQLERGEGVPAGGDHDYAVVPVGHFPEPEALPAPPPPPPEPVNEPRRRNGPRVPRGARGRDNNQVEGVRQSTGNWQTRGNSQIAPVWSRRTVVNPLRQSEWEIVRGQLLQYAAREREYYNKERKKRPKVTIDAEVLNAKVGNNGKFTRRKKQQIQQRRGVSRRPNANANRDRDLTVNPAARIRSITNRRHPGALDLDHEEILSEIEESEGRHSGAETWEETSDSGSDSGSTNSSEADDWDSDHQRSRRKKPKLHGGRRLVESDGNEDDKTEGEEATEEEDDDGESPDGRRSRRIKERSKKEKKPEIGKIKFSGSWLKQCRQLLEVMFQLPESEPFRFPVDPISFPDYQMVIDTPMDLNTVKEALQTGDYESMREFKKDVDLIFLNSKTYTPSKRAPIYHLTTRLQEYFTMNFNKIMRNVRRSESPDHQSSSKRKNSRKRKAGDSEEEDQDDEDEEEDTPPKSKKQQPAKKRKPMPKCIREKMQKNNAVSDLSEPGPSGLSRPSTSGSRRQEDEAGPSNHQSKRSNSKRDFFKTLVQSDEDSDYTEPDERPDMNGDGSGGSETEILDEDEDSNDLKPRQPKKRRAVLKKKRPAESDHNEDDDSDLPPELPSPDEDAGDDDWDVKGEYDWGADYQGKGKKSKKEEKKPKSSSSSRPRREMKKRAATKKMKIEEDSEETECEDDDAEPEPDSRSTSRTSNITSNTSGTFDEDEEHNRRSSRQQDAAAKRTAALGLRNARCASKVKYEESSDGSDYEYGGHTMPHMSSRGRVIKQKGHPKRETPVC